MNNKIFQKNESGNEEIKKVQDLTPCSCNHINSHCLLYVFAVVFVFIGVDWCCCVCRHVLMRPKVEAIVSSYTTVISFSDIGRPD